MTQNSFDVSPSCAEKQLDTKEIYKRVFKIDAHVKVLYLACLQIDRDDLADALKTVQDINWEVHDILEKAN